MLIAQISDTHIKAPGRLAYGRVDSAALLAACVAALRRQRPRPDLVVLTGDLVDLGLPEEYRHLRQILAPLEIPLLALPGNHDCRETMREAFAGDGYLPTSGFLQFVVDRFPLRLVALDTLLPGEGGGDLCPERLTWLDDALGRDGNTPTVILMHHPPFLTGIEHMDAIGLRARPAFAAIMARHPQVRKILCGHLHRMIQATVGGRPAMTAPSPAHQVALDLTPGSPGGFRMEPPAFLLHCWIGDSLVSHYAQVGEYAGPYPFFTPDGQLID